MNRLITTLFLGLGVSTAVLANEVNQQPAASFALNEFEYRMQDGEDPLAWSAEAAIPFDQGQLVIISEGERTNGVLDGHELRAFFSTENSAGWTVNLGWKGDLKPAPERNWALLGVENSLPYGIDMAISLFVRSGGDTAARFELEREFALADKWSFVSALKMNGYGQNDEETGSGSGLADAEVAVRLFYQLSEGVMPYIGYLWGKPYGQTADYAELEGEAGSTTLFMIGISLEI